MFNMEELINYAGKRANLINLMTKIDLLHLNCKIKKVQKKESNYNPI